MAFDPKFIRNFSIVAHIDHGKSTLADQLLLQSGAITQREFREQLLDDMDLERERGITIKARAVAINYTLDGQNYELNLIDTPGHVDFHYEVSRSLAACEGAILLVDATQGVQAQTVANAYAAINADLAIVPALNKIDMQAVPARRDHARRSRPRSGSTRAEVLAVSGKTGQGVPEIFRAIIDRVPPPPGDPKAPLRALIFDSKFDDYQGVVIYVRVVDGMLKVGQKIRLMARRDRARGHRPRPVPPARGRLRRAGRRPGRLRHGQHQAALRRPDRRHDHRRPRARRPRPCPATRSRSRSSSAASSRPRTTSSRTSAPRSRSSRSTTPASPSSPRRPTRSASASAAGSSACSTWRSSSSGSSARATSSLVQTAPNVTYEILTTQGRDAPHLQPDPDPRPGRHRGVPRAGRAGQLHPPVRVHRRDHAALRGPPRDVPQDRVHHPDPRHPLATSCRWPR